jgi:hypothetical protein
MGIVMMLGSAAKASPVVTLVLRVWRTGLPHGSSNPFRYEATHVQSGDVAYFRSLDAAAQHIQCLVERATPSQPGQAPIEFPRQTANQEGPPDHVS